MSNRHGGPANAGARHNALESTREHITQSTCASLPRRIRPWPAQNAIIMAVMNEQTGSAWPPFLHHSCANHGNLIGKSTPTRACTTGGKDFVAEAAERHPTMFFRVPIAIRARGLRAPRTPSQQNVRCFGAGAKEQQLGVHPILPFVSHRSAREQPTWILTIAGLPAASPALADLLRDWATQKTRKGLW